jgi:Flp pilus assembly protein TadB
VSRLRLIAIVLLVAAAALFAIGTSIERSRHHDEPATARVEEGHDEARESAEHRATVSSNAHADESSEGTVLGVDRESTSLLVLAVAVSIALALLLWQRPQRWVWLTVAGVTAVFAVFDVAEVLHQLDESAAGLVAIAMAVAVAHATTAGIAATAGTHPSAAGL